MIEPQYEKAGEKRHCQRGGKEATVFFTGRGCTLQFKIGFVGGGGEQFYQARRENMHPQSGNLGALSE